MKYAIESEKLSCGHPTAVLLASEEIDYQICEICDLRSRFQDLSAEKNEKIGDLQSIVQELREDFQVK